MALSVVKGSIVSYQEIDSDTGAKVKCPVILIDSDDAVEWFYRNEQLAISFEYEKDFLNHKQPVVISDNTTKVAALAVVSQTSVGASRPGMFYDGTLYDFTIVIVPLANPRRLAIRATQRKLDDQVE